MSASEDKPDEAKPERQEAASRRKRKESAVTPGFSPVQLKVMGFLAVILTCGLILFLFLNTQRLETPSARFLICLLVSLLLGIFFFVWWPKEYELEKIPLVNLPVRVAGPIVIWLVIFVLLLQVMPREDAPYKVYTLVNAPAGAVPYHRGITVVRPSGREVEFDLIEDRNQEGHLGKLLIKFEPGEAEIAAELRIPLHKPLPVTFKRDESIVDLSKLEYAED